VLGVQLAVRVDDVVIAEGRDQPGIAIQRRDKPFEESLAPEVVVVEDREVPEILELASRSAWNWPRRCSFCSTLIRGSAAASSAAAARASALSLASSQIRISKSWNRPATTLAHAALR
jgi:hypothetical protein